jgi:glycosyltransferase involved in cell wall biosynthesis
MGERALIYDIGDDWNAFKQSARLMRIVAQDDDVLTRRADAVMVVSAHLYELKQSAARQIYLIPNGVDARRYFPVSLRQLPPHPMTRDWPHPVLGHTGTLQPQRSDVDLIITVARAFPQGTVALVGPDSLDEDSRRRLTGEPNIRLTGPVDHAQVPFVMSAFDVCLVPHRVTAFSDSQCPLKLFEYLAAGLPIVATSVAGFRDYPDLVHLGDGEQAFIAAIGAALSESPELSRRRREAAMAHTWESRLDLFVEVLRSLPEPHP